MACVGMGMGFIIRRDSQVVGTSRSGIRQCCLSGRCRGTALQTGAADVNKFNYCVCCDSPRGMRIQHSLAGPPSSTLVDLLSTLPTFDSGPASGPESCALLITSINGPMGQYS